MRLVDLGVSTCIDSVIRHCEILLDENTSQAEQERAKAQIRLNAGIYRNTLEELLLALDEPRFTKETPNQTASKCLEPQLTPAEQCEKILVALEASKALVNVNENYTLFLRSLGKDYLLNELGSLSHIHSIYLNHISEEVNSLHLQLERGE